MTITVHFGSQVHPDSALPSLRCTCPSGDGSLVWPCPAHPPEVERVRASSGSCDSFRAASAPAAAPSAVIQALKGEIPLVEPVYIGKALRAGRKARVSLSGGVGPLACVMLVNIQLTPWVHTEETANAFADGYNRALGDLRSAVLDVTRQDDPSTAPANDNRTAVQEAAAQYDAMDHAQLQALGQQQKGQQ